MKEEAGPLYLALADHLKRDIENGVLSAGDRLPTHRDLADALGVTVGTVSRGYAEAEKRGLIQGQVGRGTFVASDAGAGKEFLFQEASGPTIDLGLNAPLNMARPDLSQVLAELAGHDDVNGLLGYVPAKGLERHRRAGALWMSGFGLDVPPGDVFVTAGGQHALVVLLTGLFSPGDSVFVEELTYPGVKGLAASLKIRLEPVACDGQGMIPGALDAACRAHGGKGLYVMPGLHNPTNAHAPEERREELAFIARRHDLLIMEDDPYSQLLSRVVPPLSVFAPERSFNVCSLSKSVAGGLRIGYVSAPPMYHNALSRAISHTLWMAPPLMAEIAARWIMDGTAQRTLGRVRRELGIRNAMAAEALQGLDMDADPASYHLWLRLPEPWRGSDFEQVARDRGVAVFSAERFVVGRAPLPFAVRVSLGGMAGRDMVGKGLEALADILREPV